MSALLMGMGVIAQGSLPSSTKEKIKNIKVEQRLPLSVIQTAKPGSGNNNAPVSAKVAPANASTYAGTITQEEYAAHLDFLSSDELEGRETAERGQKIAAKYLATQFQRIGLQPGNDGSWYQEYKLTRTKVNDLEVSFNGKTRLKLFKDFIVFNGGAFKDAFDAPLAFAGFAIEEGTYNNFDNLNLKGKVAFVLDGEPTQNGKSIFAKSDDYKSQHNWRSKVKTLESTGAKGAVFVLEDKQFNQMKNNPWMKHRMEGSQLALTHLKTGGLPFLAISETAANALIKKSKTKIEDLREDMSVSHVVSPLNFGKNRLVTYPDVNEEVVIAENVLGFLEGTDKKDEVIVLTAHYDHLGVKDGVVFNGADDDGTGTTALIEIAEAFAIAAKNGHRPRRSILFMPVSGEEKGLLGSRYYTDFPVYPLANTVCNLNIDMIGRTDANHENGNYIYVIGSDMLSTDLHEANEKANRELTKIELDYRYNNETDPNRYYYRSDHYNFAKNDIPCIFYFSGVHADYHKSTDTFEKIDMVKSTRITKLVFATAWEVANRDKRLVVDKKK